MACVVDGGILPGEVPNDDWEVDRKLVDERRAALEHVWLDLDLAQPAVGRAIQEHDHGRIDTCPARVDDDVRVLRKAAVRCVGPAELAKPVVGRDECRLELAVVHAVIADPGKVQPVRYADGLRGGARGGDEARAREGHGSAVEEALRT